MKKIITMTVLFIFCISCSHKTAEQLCGIGNQSYASGKYLDAIKKYSKAIALNPDYPDAIWKRGLSEYAISDFTSAKKDFTTIIEKKTRLEAYYYRGMCELSLQDSASSCQDFKEACDYGINQGCNKLRVHCK